MLCSSLLPHLTRAPICAACWSEPPQHRANCCFCCGEDLFLPARADGQAMFCRACRMAPPGFVRAVSGGVYEGVIRGAIHALKYDGIAPVARTLGERLADAIAQLFDENCPQRLLILPVPLHRAKLRERSFNQARNLAEEAMRHLRLRHPERALEILSGGLTRQRATESQAGLTPRQRRQNLRGAFFVPHAQAVRGRHVLLIDDIYTTGATARACSRAPLEIGAASVRIATVARAQRRFPNQQPGIDPTGTDRPGEQSAPQTIH